MNLATLLLLWKERGRLFKAAIYYKSLTTGRRFGLIKAARYVLKNPPGYDREWEAAQEKADRHRRHIKNQSILEKLMEGIEE